MIKFWLEKNIRAESGRIHKILAESYLFYFLFFLLGVYLDLIFPIKPIPGQAGRALGLVVIVFATLLVLWAQRSSRHLDAAKDNFSPDSFRRGPYRFTRSPTHWGLFFLLFGFGLSANALFVMLFILLAFVVTRALFITEEEKILEKKYGSAYLEYKKSVKF
ncbi:hypothetical protein A3G06_00210 [Candidatus Nomurabacteria bacterium RIFCSPLOWO2_12_FULL_46_14]|uniref:Steroid 5-alpha reductase C-terminal domain-containing protein n=1 Tax=Candidatus Nomurabacteria bacterium RIFCSPLOWO2_12_FULL_46_14 TaxID=1801797 RepID=A0A1F6Y8W2_9BACT|nr:MAG: hypothetical protein A3G06_00210 [Candidatus Nomurabacteria bacterium RIFCSPLOWO2_12_FULL_46_14]